MFVDQLACWLFPSFAYHFPTQSRRQAPTQQQLMSDFQNLHTDLQTLLWTGQPVTRFHAAVTEPPSAEPTQTTQELHVNPLLECREARTCRHDRFSRRVSYACRLRRDPAVLEHESTGAPNAQLIASSVGCTSAKRATSSGPTGNPPM